MTGLYIELLYILLTLALSCDHFVAEDHEDGRVQADFEKSGAPLSGLPARLTELTILQSRRPHSN